MGWFSKTPVVVSPSAEEVEASRLKALQEAELRRQQISWIKSVPNSDLLDVFSKLELTIRNVTQDVDRLSAENREAWQKALDGFSQMHRIWFEIDRNLLSDKQASDMFSILVGSLPKAVNSYAARALRVGPQQAWSYDYDRQGGSKDFQQVFIGISNIHNSQASGFSALNIPSAAIASSAVMTFPLFASENKVVSDSLVRLSELWNQASSRKNTVEDEYFLEQVVSSYLPDAWRLFETFRFAPVESKATAEGILLEQLGLIESHIVHILRSAMEQSLVAMRSQVGFLKVKTAIAEESSLQLTASVVG